ncbi:hypothetical protein [Pseudoalteromonas galatheae]|uniref:hypothetical protein n=1 Tax=Pseudoalteromonas galatheae TaxID=579562 RepID=UPI0030D32884
MATINTTFNAQQIAEQVVSILERFYTANRQHITIGLTEDGLVDFDYSSDNQRNVVLELFDTEQGFDSLGEFDSEFEESDDEFWTEEVKAELAKSFIEWNREAIDFNDEFIVNHA